MNIKITSITMPIRNRHSKYLFLKNIRSWSDLFLIFVLNSDGSYTLTVQKQDGMVYNYSTEQEMGERKDVELNLKGNVGQIIETNDFKFLITINNKDSLFVKDNRIFAFRLSTIKQLVNQLEESLEFNIPDKLATVIEISMETTSVQLGEDVINELIQVYSASNLEKKNHLANMTLEYIDEQLDEVSASLNHTENNLQQFMSQNKLMNVDEQSTGWHSSDWIYKINWLN